MVNIYQVLELLNSYKILTAELLNFTISACELRETAGLDVWSALLYDTLVLDLAAVEALNAEILLSLQPSAIPNMSLVRRTLCKIK